MIEKLCLILGAIVLLNAEKTYDTKYACGNEYSMNSLKTLYFNFNGHDEEREKCEIKFTLTDTTDYKICVRPVSLNLDCGTIIEYQEHLVAEYINDGELDCSMNGRSLYAENCVDYVHSFFIVIKRESSTWDADERASFHVYTEENQIYSTGIGSGSFTSTTSTKMLGLIALAPILVIIMVCIVCMAKKRQMNTNTNTQVLYNTSVSATAMPTGGVSQYPVTPNQQAYPQSGYPQSGYPQSAGPGNPVQQSAGGYIVHPTVTAYPVQNPEPPGPYHYQPVPQPLDGGMQATPALNPSAPPPDDKSLPPPSYESLLNK